ncbi:MAG: ATP-binding cassette domain-containing protein [Coriobacteriia bacterium]|nr:ATP-binding cassette domain-containing protein [Coriobacteriia bacterium]
MQLEAVSLSKVYGNKTALHDVSFVLEPGIFGLLGPNGSGKSTLMNIITGNLRQSSGQVVWNGQETKSLGSEYRAVLGYVPQQHVLYPEFNASRFLYYMAALKGLATAEAEREVPRVLAAVELEDVAKDRIKSFSGGMKQRLAIAQAVLGSPKLLIMDEPTVGLDPYQRESIRQMIVELAANKIVLVSTHVVSDIEWISSAILLLKDGELIRIGSRDSLVNEVGSLINAKAKSLDRQLGLEDVYLYFYGEEHEKDHIL